MYISLYIHRLYRHILDTASTTLYIMDGISHTAFPQSNMALGNPHICHEQKPSVKISHRYWLHNKYGCVYGTSTNIWRFPEMVPKSSIYSAISPKSPILIAGWWFGTWFLFFHYIRYPWTRTCERYPGVDKSYLIMRRTPPGQVPAHQVSVWKQELSLIFLICWKVLIFTRI